MNYLLIGIVLASLLVLILTIFQYSTYKKLRSKELELKQGKLLMQQSENEYLVEQIELVRQNIISKSLWQAQVNNLLDDLKYSIGQLKREKKTYTQQDIEKLELKIEIERNKEENWEEFLNNFEKINPDFFKKMSTIFSNLTQSDLRLCAFVRLNFTSQEVSDFLNISASSVNTARYRLRKKLKLSKDIDLNTFINQL